MAEHPPQIKVGSITVAYVESGAGEPLVMAHGGESHRGQYDLFRPLLGPGIRAIAYDQRDVGDTRNGSEPYNMATLGADCAGLIEALGYERAHVMGTSLGGAIALHTALDHPERVASLTLISTPPSVTTQAGPAEKVMGMSPPQREQFMLDAVISPEGQRADPALVEQVRALLKGSAASGGRRQAAIRSHDCTDRLPAITAPTLVVNGDEDPLVTISTAELLAAEIPDASLEIIAGGRHGLTLEHRAITAGLVRDFVLAHPAGPTARPAPRAPELTRHRAPGRP